MAWKFNPFTSKQDYYQTAATLPSITIDFDTADPNTPGTIFTPEDQLNTDALYISAVNNSQWTSNGVAYQTFTPPTSAPSTEFYLNGTTIDAGSNKTASISRTGKVYVGGLAVNNNYSLPTTAPAVGQVLGYGIGGTTEWVTPADSQANTVLFADLATTEALNACTYYNGVSNDGVGATLTGNVNGQLATISNPTKIDNVVTALNQVILVWNQVNQIQNGLYRVTQLGSVSQPFIIVRAEDADQQSELYPIQVNIFFGAIYSNRAFLQKTVDPVVGVSNIVFAGSQIGISTAPIIYLDTVTSSPLPTCTYASGTNAQIPGFNASLTADVNGALGTINGIALVANMRILVKDQVNQAHNGDYIVNSIGGTTSKWKLYRLSAWGGEFLKAVREWKVNNSNSNKFGARYSTNLSTLSNLNVGITSLIFNGVTSGGGICGIANSSGVYTYYTTLNLAITAATSGQTIELFTDITETGSVSITTKVGVKINGNGYTYTLSVNDATHAIVDGSTFTELSNIKVVRTGRAGNSTGVVFFTNTSINAVLKCQNVVFENTYGVGVNLYRGTIYGLTVNSYGTCITTGYEYGYIYDCNLTSGNSIGYDNSYNAGEVQNCIVTANLTAIMAQGGTVYNSIGRSTSGTGIQANTRVVNSTGTSSSGIGISSPNGYNCVGISTSGIGLSGTFTNSTGISTSGYGGTNGTKTNCTLISSSNYASFQENLNNSFLQSTTNVPLWLSTGKIVNTCTALCLWDNVGGHAINTTSASTGVDIRSCNLTVTNASAYCINGASGSTYKYANSSYKGSTTPVNTTNVAQGITNTSDSQGNILI